jgi:hypothetical protein
MPSLFHSRSELILSRAPPNDPVGLDPLPPWRAVSGVGFPWFNALSAPWMRSSSALNTNLVGRSNRMPTCLLCKQHEGQA